MSIRRPKTASVRARRDRANFEQLESRTLFAIVVAENLLVDVDATALPAGAVTDIANNGTLGGVFRANGPAGTAPVIGRPDATATSGTNGIRFDGTDYLQLVDALGTLIPAPEGITGADPSASIEVWVWNPGVAGEETLVSWGHRGGPDGTNYSFNYGNSDLFGAMGHWGAPHAGWGPPGGAQQTPVAKQWHHLAYTYDATASVNAKPMS